MKNKLTWVRAISIGMLFSSYILMAMTFLTAYFDERKRVLVFIDLYHEANLELVVFIILTPLLFLTWGLMEIRNNGTERNN